MFTRLLLVAILSTSSAFAASPQAEGFRKLNGPQIRNAFVGKQFSDGVHFSYRYLADGTIQGAKMGKKVADKWAITKDQLCVWGAARLGETAGCGNLNRNRRF